VRPGGGGFVDAGAGISSFKDCETHAARAKIEPQAARRRGGEGGGGGEGAGQEREQEKEEEGEEGAHRALYLCVECVWEWWVGTRSNPETQEVVIGELFHSLLALALRASKAPCTVSAR